MEGIAEAADWVSGSEGLQMLDAVTVELPMRFARLSADARKLLYPSWYLSIALGHDALDPSSGPLHHDEMP